MEPQFDIISNVSRTDFQIYMAKLQSPKSGIYRFKNTSTRTQLFFTQSI